MAATARARALLLLARESSAKLNAHYLELAAEARRRGLPDRAAYYDRRAAESAATVTRCERIIASPRVMVR